MENKVIRKLDCQARINLNMKLLRLLQIKTGEKVAICKAKKGTIAIRKLNNLAGRKVIACVRVDDKGRIRIPLEIRMKFTSTEFQIYVMNKSLILEEAH